MFISSCSSGLYDRFESPILTENTFIVNDTIVKKNPVKLLIQPSTPTNKFLGYPLGLYIYNLSSENADERFDSWINKKPKRYARLSKILSEKQIIQLKKYNNLRQFDSPVFKFDSSVLISGGVKEGPNLGKAISFLKHRWISNNYSITDKDIEDAIEIYK